MYQNFLHIAVVNFSFIDLNVLQSRDEDLLVNMEDALATEA